MEEVGSSGKISLSENVVLVLLAVKAGAVKEGSRFLPSRRVRVRVLEGDQRRIRFYSWPLWPAEQSRELVVLDRSGASRAGQV